ncbi:MAG: hypothetical protein M3373_00110 [Gemmatimonadota bacterium]|nr:hypothetical protein [Gemmatimonadota bacterium]
MKPPRRPLTILLAALPIAVWGLGVSCATQPRAATLPARSLAGLVGQPLIILPIRYLRPADSPGWAGQVGDPRAFLGRVDDELAFAVRSRGITGPWTWPEELARAAQRNPLHATDPYQIAAEALRPGPRQRPSEVSDPLASQLRSLIALRDARFALVPVEVRFESRGGGTGRAVLHVALVDARLARVTWSGEVASDSAAALSPALPVSLAERFADLFAAR